jgi:hypothetical protein
MRRVVQQSAHTGNPSLRKPSPCICRVGGSLTVARPDRPRKRFGAFSAGLGGKRRDARVVPHEAAPVRQVS